MKLNFEDEQETESDGRIKVPQTDFFYNEQVKMEEIYKLKVSIKFIKILSIILVIFCLIFIFFQVFHDYQLTSFQKEINKLKNEIEDLKSISHDFKNLDKVIKDEKIEPQNINAIVSEKPKIFFTAETIKLKEKFKKEIQFLQDCMTETKISKFKQCENPKISIIVPAYKSDQHIYRLMISIQKQKFTEVEIIFVKNLDKDYPKLEEIRKLDDRIVILTNDENKGMLNSYVKGILNAKSKYVIFLEEEGMLLPNLENIYNVTSIYDVDIYDFSCIKGTNNGIRFDEKLEGTEKNKNQVSELYYNENFLNDNPMLNKIIKTEVIKNAVKNIKNSYLEAKFDLHADSLLYICLCSYSDSYRSFGDLYGEYHIKSEISKSAENLQKMFDSTIDLAQYIYDLIKDDEKVFNQRCLLVINLFSWPLNYNIKLHIQSDRAKKVIYLFFNHKYISDQNKRKINLLFRKIKDRKY